MNYVYWIGSRFIRTSQTIMVALSICWLVVIPVQAQVSINLKQALKLTLIENAELKAYPLIIRGAEAMQLQANLRPNPVLGVEIENTLGSGNFQSFDRSEISVTYSQLLELGNKQENRFKFASEKTRRLQSEYQLARLDVLAETSRRYYRNIALQEQQVWIIRRISSEKKALQAIQRRAKAGAVGEADVSKMALRLARSEIQQRQLSDELILAQSRLAAMWMTEADFTSLEGSFDHLPVIPDRETITLSIERLPSVQHQLALQRLADTRVQLARSNGQSDMTFTVGLRQHQQTSDQSLNFSFSMPMAFENPNRGRIAAAQIDREKTVQQSEWIKQQLKLTLLETRQRLLNLNTHARLLKNELLPKARKLLVETERGYKKGSYSVLQWIDAQSELFSIEKSLINIHWQIYQQYLELERITGQPMTVLVISPTGDGQ